MTGKNVAQRGEQTLEVVQVDLVYAALVSIYIYLLGKYFKM
jgi:hypothetical protein